MLTFKNEGRNNRGASVLLLSQIVSRILSEARGIARHAQTRVLELRS